MPLVHISLVAGWSPADKRRISDVVHAALVVAFRIPPEDYHHRINEYPPADFVRPPGKTDKFVLVEMTVFPGRSPEAKKRLFAGIAAGLAPLGIAGNDLMIVLNEPPLTNWGIRGGVRADEADRGFKLEV